MGSKVDKHDIKELARYIGVGALVFFSSDSFKSASETFFHPIKIESMQTRMKLDQVNYNLLVLQYQLSGMSLDSAIEAANEH